MTPGTLWQALGRVLGTLAGLWLGAVAIVAAGLRRWA